GHATADRRRRVGHGANYRDGCTGVLLDVSRRHGGGDGNHQGAGVELWRNFSEDIPNHLGLYAEEDDIRPADGIAIVGGDRNTQPRVKGDGFVAVLYGRCYIFGVE